MAAAGDILIVSPAEKRENNGNWQTASRWAQFLRPGYRVRIVRGWEPGDPVPDLMIGLHALRSAPSLAAFAATGRPSVLVMTGTDLYRDLPGSGPAGASGRLDALAALEQATRIVVLQPKALEVLPVPAQAKAQVIYQSAPPLAAYSHPLARRHIDFVMAGHLRREKDPLTFIRASQLIEDRRIRFTLIGNALEPQLGEAAQAAHSRNFQWLGSLPHGDTRQRLKRSHAMVITSLMEAGANVIIEAVTAGTPVLASDIPGNRGMLGDDYAGFFPAGDAAALAALATRSVTDPAYYALLRTQSAARAPLFAPEREAAAVRALAAALLSPVR
ncbi:TIGR04348 family glycosyltransferase [Massilia arenosa]|uniref:TIGR04348 family glycosyltransferase n=1 Tax=Zemynaea arenosa TaxID=2561931 RepID=A0A4Y9S586_9BURK|nr:selenoneine biosynthesis selenosugar synthase SenB [Massilia arenosa]TFW16510.1 TIGR04348 family glycosyltransferase [Massilia arenosa]